MKYIYNSCLNKMFLEKLNYLDLLAFSRYDIKVDTAKRMK